MVTHTWNLCSALTHPKYTHTAVHTHTVNTPGAVGSHLCCGVRCLAQGHLSRGIEGGDRALYIHSPHLQILPARDSNSQPFDNVSNSVTIRPRLPQYQISPNVGIDR